MFDIGKRISYTIASTAIVIAYVLYFLIIWYIKTKPLGTITSFDKVNIDTILVRLSQMAIIYIGCTIYIIDGSPIQDATDNVLITYSLT